MKPWSKRGFSYQDSQARGLEFWLAKEYFKANPTEVKISRKRWKKLYPDNTPQHSYLKRSDGAILAIAHGKERSVSVEKGLLGEGASGRVKYAMNSAGELYVLKIEINNTLDQQNEEIILKELGILHGEKTYSGQNGKYYSTLTHLGTALVDTTIVTAPMQSKLEILRKIAWNVHALHEKGIAHHDLKPDNITIDKRSNRIGIVDFGLAKKIVKDWEPPAVISGTGYYLPRYRGENDDEVRNRMRALGQIGCDIFALKKTFQDILTVAGMALLTPSLKKILSTSDPNNLKQVTALDVTFALLEFQMSQSYPDITFPVNLTEEQKTMACTCFSMLDEMKEVTAETGKAVSKEFINGWQKHLIELDPNEYVSAQEALTEYLEQAVCETLSFKIKERKINDEPILTDDNLQKYAAEIITSTDMDMQATRQRLTTLNKCSSLLDEISQQAIGGALDLQMNTFITETIKDINDAAFDADAGQEHQSLNSQHLFPIFIIKACFSPFSRD